MFVPIFSHLHGLWVREAGETMELGVGRGNQTFSAQLSIQRFNHSAMPPQKQVGFVMRKN